MKDEIGRERQREGDNNFIRDRQGGRARTFLASK